MKVVWQVADFENPTRLLFPSTQSTATLSSLYVQKHLAPDFHLAQNTP